jgi:DNA-binding response OmpR family regulator
VRVLVVEDEADLAGYVAEGLRDHGMAVDVALDGAQALEKVATNSYDLVVLDRDLPVVHGDAVCSALARSQESPLVLMLTASGDVDDRIEGLRLGADDYLPKPFAFAELVLRVRALGRRATGAHLVYRRGDLHVDLSRHRVNRAGRDIALTAKEFAVLEVLLAADEAVVTSEELLEKVWDEHADSFTNTVRVTMGRLRRKLGEPPLIETLIGVGYRMP